MALLQSNQARMVMFRQRLLTSLMLVPLVLLAIYYANMGFLGSIVVLLVIACGWEWTQLVPISNRITKLFFILGLLFMTWLSMHWFYDWLIVGLMLWVFILVAVLSFPASQAFWGNRISVSAACFILLPLFASSFAALYQHANGKDMIVYLLCLVWATDIGGYLVGKGIGHHKLIPKVSPGKTLEGSSGGFLLAMLVAIIGYFYFRPYSVGIWVGIAVGTTLISMLGDLFISMLKRRCKLKDTGHLIPGHGGVLDRLDSLIAALPLFYCGLSFLATIK